MMLPYIISRNKMTYVLDNIPVCILLSTGLFDCNEIDAMSITGCSLLYSYVTLSINNLKVRAIYHDWSKLATTYWRFDAMVQTCNIHNSPSQSWCNRTHHQLYHQNNLSRWRPLLMIPLPIFWNWATKNMPIEIFN